MRLIFILMRKVFFFILLFISISLVVQSQAVVYINAGSRAPYGFYQDLQINNNGQVKYRKVEVNGRVKDSSSFTITRVQLDSFFRKADQVGFFQLNAMYDGGFVDGAGILISLNNAGKKHMVQLKNTDVPQVNDLIAWVNKLLKPRNIRIYYGQK